jgi:NAD(P)-dependent dehydrogenase (short-subunit alcohol dehydrogenase family)
MNLKLWALLGATVAALHRLATYRMRAYPIPSPRGAIVITGASSGIGHHAAVSLARANYTVFAGVRSENDAKAIAALDLDTLLPLIVDVAKPHSVLRAVEQVEDTLTRIGVPLVALVNNAGIRCAVAASEPQTSCPPPERLALLTYPACVLWLAVIICL